MSKEEYLQKFKELYKQKEGKDLTDQEALEHLERLNVLVRAVYKPVSRRFIEDPCCPSCGEEINFKHFKDRSSKEEFTISGLCQDCQDFTF